MLFLSLFSRTWKGICHSNKQSQFLVKCNRVCRDLPASCVRASLGSVRWEIQLDGVWHKGAQTKAGKGFLLLCSSAADSVGGCTPVSKWSSAPLALLRETPALCDGINVSLKRQQQLINFTRNWVYFLLSECPFWNFKSKAAKLVTGPLLSKLFWFSFERFPNCTQPKKARACGTQGLGIPLQLGDGAGVNTRLQGILYWH